MVVIPGWEQRKHHDAVAAAAQSSEGDELQTGPGCCRDMEVDPSVTAKTATAARSAAKNEVADARRSAHGGGDSTDDNSDHAEARSLQTDADDGWRPECKWRQ